MEVEDIKQKSISGAKWAFVLSILALPIGYLTNIILGKVSPEALGIYSLLNIFENFVLTFIFFGGTNVLIKYLPEVNGNKKILFIKSYLIIIFAFILAFTILFHVYPHIWTIILGKSLPSYILTFFIYLTPVIVIYYFFDNVLNGLVEIKTAIIIRQLFTYGYFIIFTSLFVLNSDFFFQNIWIIIFSTYSIICIFSCILAFHLAFKKMIGKKYFKFSNILKSFQSLNVYLPKKFLGFALFVQISTILVFAYDKLDQIFVLNYFGLNMLGFYFAAIQTSSLIRFIPLLMGNIMLPAFSNLLVLNESEPIQKGYSFLSKYTILIVVPIALLFVFFSKQIMGIFGPAYEDYDIILVILSLSLIFTSLGNINYALILSHGKARALLIVSVVQITLQLFLTFILIGEIGIMGIVIPKVIGVLIAQLCIFYILLNLIDLKIEIPSQYISSSVVGILALFIYLIFRPNTFLSSTLALTACILLFVYLARYRFRDIMFVINNIK